MASLTTSASLALSPSQFLFAVACNYKNLNELAPELFKQLVSQCPN